MSNFIEVKVKTSGVDKSISELDHLRKTISEIGKGAEGFKGFMELLKRFGPAVAVVGLEVTAITLAFEKLFESIKEVAKMAAELEVLSIQTGVAAGQLFILQKALQDSGQSAEQAGGVIGHMQRAIGEGLDSTSKQAEAFKALGLHAEELDAADPAAQFERITTAFQQLQNPTTRVSVAMAIFGKEGRSMIPLLREGLIDAADRFGAMANAMEQLAEPSHKIESSFKHIGELINAFTAGGLSSFADQIKGIAKGLDDLDLPNSSSILGRFFGDAIKSGEILNLQFTLVMASAEKLLGITGPATKKIQAMMDDAAEGLTHHTEETQKLNNTYDQFNRTIEKTISLESLLRHTIQDLHTSEQALAIVQSTGLGSRRQARQAEIDSLTERMRLLKQTMPIFEGEVKTLERLKAASLAHPGAESPEADKKLAENLEKARGAVATLRTEWAGLVVDMNKAQIDPSSFVDQWREAIGEIEKEMGTLAENMKHGLKAVANQGVAVIGEEFTNVILKAETFNQAIRKIGQTILRSLINEMITGILRAGVAFVASKILEGAVTKSTLELKAADAMLTSIGSYGGAAVAGEAAFTGAMALAASTAGAFFERGGYTGPGAKDQVTGVVHAGEFVLTADQVKAIGLNRLNTAFRTGAVQTPSLSSAQATGMIGNPLVAGLGNTNFPGAVQNPSISNEINVRLAAFDSRQDAERWASSEKAEAWFVDMARKTVHRWGAT